MISEQDKETLATTDAMIRVVAAVAYKVQNPSAATYYRNAALESKVAASLNKKLAKHYTRAG